MQAHKMLTNTLIPRTILFSDPDRILVKLSPNGKYISYLAPFEGNLNLWLVSIDNLNAHPITKVEHPLRDYWWVTQDHLLYIHDHFGDENWQLHGYQLSTGKTTTYTKQGLQTRIFQKSDTKPQLLIGLNDRDRRFHDVYQLDLPSGDLELRYENFEYWDFYADEDFNLIAGLKVKEMGGEYREFSESGRCLAKVSLNDLFGLYFYPKLRLGLSAMGNQLFLTQTDDTNTSRLIAVDLENLHVTTLGGDLKADICDVLIDPKTKTPLAYAVNYDRKKWHGLSETTQCDLEFLKTVDDGDIDIYSENNEQWVVSFLHDDRPLTYYLYHRSLKKADYLFESHPAFKNYSFTKMHPREIATRDGLTCVSYLSLPKQSDKNGQGLPLKPVPMVLMVHGGPNYRDFWGFNPVHQWLTNRGLAVLSVNYRASTGYGRAHFAAGHGEWGRKIHQDLLDAVQWAVDQKITTSDQVAIMGRSFGGYATLIGLTFTPDVFCCGVDMVGPANLETMAKHFPPYWKAIKGAIHEMLGCDPESEQGKAYLKERSPLWHADRIKKPLLIGHGANDVRVLQSESDAMVNAMQDNGIAVTYAIFPDEGHQMLHPGNRMAFYALAEAFLAQNLGCDYEPYDKTIETSMIVKVDDFKLYHE